MEKNCETIPTRIRTLDGARWRAPERLEVEVMFSPGNSLQLSEPQSSELMQYCGAKIPRQLWGMPVDAYFEGKKLVKVVPTYKI